MRVSKGELVKEARALGFSRDITVVFCSVDCSLFSQWVSLGKPPLFLQDGTIAGGM
jgi:hypothetical protein